MHFKIHTIYCIIQYTHDTGQYKYVHYTGLYVAMVHESDFQEERKTPLKWQRIRLSGLWSHFGDSSREQMLSEESEIQ